MAQTCRLKTAASILTLISAASVNRDIKELLEFMMLFWTLAVTAFTSANVAETLATLSEMLDICCAFLATPGISEVAYRVSSGRKINIAYFKIKHYYARSVKNIQPMTGKIIIANLEVRSYYTLERTLLGIFPLLPVVSLLLEAFQEILYGKGVQLAFLFSIVSSHDSDWVLYVAFSAWLTD